MFFTKTLTISDKLPLKAVRKENTSRKLISTVIAVQKGSPTLTPNHNWVTSVFLLDPIYSYNENSEYGNTIKGPSILYIELQVSHKRNTMLLTLGFPTTWCKLS